MNANQYRDIGGVLQNIQNMIWLLTGFPSERYLHHCNNKEVRAIVKKELQDLADEQIINNAQIISADPKRFRKYNELIKAMIATLED